jgi:hypothetical protein
MVDINELYNVNYSCRYKNTDELNKYLNLKNTKNADIDIDIDINNEIYRLDVLNIYKLKTFEDNTIVSKLDYIYDNFIANSKDSQVEKFCNIVVKASQLFMSNDVKFGLMVLYSYEYLDNTHKCICELIKTHTIREETLQDLENLF